MLVELDVGDAVLDILQRRRHFLKGFGGGQSVSSGQAQWQ